MENKEKDYKEERFELQSMLTTTLSARGISESTIS